MLVFYNTCFISVGVNPVVGRVASTYMWTAPGFLTTWSLITYVIAFYFSKMDYWLYVVCLIRRRYELKSTAPFDPQKILHGAKMQNMCKCAKASASAGPRLSTGDWPLDHTRGHSTPSSPSCIKWQWVSLLQYTVVYY